MWPLAANNFFQKDCEYSQMFVILYIPPYPALSAAVFGTRNCLTIILVRCPLLPPHLFLVHLFLAPPPVTSVSIDA